MLLPYLEVLNSKKIILGSQSKMRNELMQVQVKLPLFKEIEIWQSLINLRLRSGQKIIWIPSRLQFGTFKGHKRKHAEEKSKNWFKDLKHKPDNGTSWFAVIPLCIIMAKLSKNLYLSPHLGKLLRLCKDDGRLYQHHSSSVYSQHGNFQPVASAEVRMGWRRKRTAIYNFRCLSARFPSRPLKRTLKLKSRTFTVEDTSWLERRLHLSSQFLEAWRRFRALTCMECVTRSWKEAKS